MKTTFKIALLTLLISGTALVSKAQTTAAKQSIRLSIGPEFGLPAGKLSDAYDWSFGGSVQADFPVVKDLFVTVNSGYNNVFGKNDFVQDLQLIPVKAGLKYFPVKSFYVQGEAGATFLTNKSDFIGANSASFVYAPQIGVLLPLGQANNLDAGVRFESNSKFSDGGKNSNFFGLRVAYSFNL